MGMAARRKTKFLKRKLAPAQKVLFTYSTKHLSDKDKVRFYYALKGRDGKSGILKALKAEFLAKGVLLVEQKQVSELREFFEYWSCPYQIRGKLKENEQI